MKWAHDIKDCVTRDKGVNFAQERKKLNKQEVI